MVSELREFWSRVAQQYDQVSDLQIGPMTRLIVLDRVLKEGRLGKLAEFGCGTGFYTEALASKADTIMATGISPGMLATAKANIRALMCHSR
jgi:methylase of polypeptide subunit release factors